MQSSRNSHEDVGVDDAGHRIAPGKIDTKSQPDPAELAARKLGEAREELEKSGVKLAEQQKHVESAKTLARQVNAILQGMKSAAGTVNAKSILQDAMDDCEECINAPNEAGHHKMLTHIARAENHLGRAVPHMHKPPTHGHHHAPHELRHVHEHSQHIAS